MRKNRGFTLIEMLIVLMIIVLLATVVLASLQISRKRSNDQAIKANLSTIQTEAEVYAQNYLTANPTGTLAYGKGQNLGRCAPSGGGYMVTDQDPIIRNAIVAIGSTAIGQNVTDAQLNGSSSKMMCFSNQYINGTGPDYTIVVLLSDGSVWCIDSTGQSTGFAGPINANFTSGGVTHSCAGTQ